MFMQVIVGKDSKLFSNGTSLVWLQLSKTYFCRLHKHSLMMISSMLLIYTVESVGDLPVYSFHCIGYRAVVF